MTGALITWALCILSFLAGFILCSMFRIGRLEDVDRMEAADANKPTTDDYIDWSKVPEGYDWVAVDGEDVYNDGILARCHEMKPEISEWGDYFIDDSGADDIAVRSSAIIGPLPPWRESLRHRPTTERTPL